MNIHLIIHNIASIIASIILLGLSLFIFLNGKRKMANIALALTTLSAAVFTISHAIGANIFDPNISKAAFMFNLSIFFIGCFNVHAIISLINKNQEKKLIVRLFYFSTILITIFFIIFSDLFLLPSVPKMYFPNYYEPGVLNWTRLVFLYVISFPYMIYLLQAAYKKSNFTLEKNQYKYFIITVIVGYVLGFVPNFLVYDIQIDPAWGMPFPLLFAFPFIYGAVKYELFNVKIIAKQAFFFSLGIAAVGGIITLLNYSNNLIMGLYPNYPPWITAFVSAVLVVTISVIVWKHLREGDLLKYEFITIVTHKLRTPLTSIKWSAENLLPAVSADKQVDLIRIKDSVNRLVELTNILANVSLEEGKDYLYSYKTMDLADLCQNIASEHLKQAELKNISLTIKNLTGKPFPINADFAKLRILLQILLDNALTYTKNGGKVSLSLSREKSNVVISIADTGIGLSKNEARSIFSKFYRTEASQKSYTEGMGIGLSIAKNIAERHGGKIWLESGGAEKGTTFFVSLPIKDLRI